MARIAVVGGAGFIGSHLVERFMHDGDPVLVLDDLSTGRLGNLGPARRLGRVGFHTVSVDDPSIVYAIERFDPQLIVHAAVPTPSDRGIRDPIETSASVVRQVAALTEASRKTGARLLIVAGATDLYGAMTHLPAAEAHRPRPIHPHGAAIYAALRYVEVRLPGRWCVLAIAETFGARQLPNQSPLARLIDDLDRGRVPVVPTDRSFALDYLHVDDVVEAIMRAARRGAGLINIGSGEAVAFDDLSTRVFACFDGGNGIREADLEYPFPAELALDPTVAATRLAWKRSVPIDEGLAATVESRRNA